MEDPRVTRTRELLEEIQQEEYLEQKAMANARDNLLIVSIMAMALGILIAQLL